MSDALPPPTGPPVDALDVADQPLGPGWWRASDGRFYPPHLAPSAPPLAAASTATPPAWVPPAWVPPASTLPAPTLPAPSGPVGVTVRVGGIGRWSVAVIGAAIAIVVAVIGAVVFFGGDEPAPRAAAPRTSTTVTPSSNGAPPSSSAGAPAPGGAAGSDELVVYDETFDDTATFWDRIGSGLNATYGDGTLGLSSTKGIGRQTVRVPYANLESQIDLSASITELDGTAVLGCSADLLGGGELTFSMSAAGAYELSSDTVGGTLPVDPVTGSDRTFGRSAELSIRCDEQGPGDARLRLTAFVDGRRIASLAVPGPTGVGWWGSVGLAGESPGRLVLDEITIRDPQRRRVAVPAVAWRRGTLAIDQDLRVDPSGWEGGPEGSLSADGRFTVEAELSESRFDIVGPEVTGDAVQVEVTARLLTALPDGGVASAGGYVGAGCRRLVDGSPVTYAFAMAADGGYVIDKTDALNGRSALLPLRIGGTKGSPSGAPVGISCSTVLDGDGRSVVRIVGFVGGQQVAETFDADDGLTGGWVPQLELSSLLGGLVAAEFDRVVVRTS